MTTESSTTSTRIRSPGWSIRLFSAAISRSLWMDPRKLELLYEDVFGEWLHDVLVGARLPGRRHLIQFGLGGDHDYYQRRKFRLPAQLLEHLQPIDLGHVPVRQNQRHRGLFGFDHLQGFSSVGRLPNLEPEFSQGLGEDHPNRPRIVHN